MLEKGNPGGTSCACIESYMRPNSIPFPMRTWGNYDETFAFVTKKYTQILQLMLLNIGHFFNWMSRMLFCMEISKKKSICDSLML